MRSDSVFSMTLVGLVIWTLIDPRVGLGVLLCVATCKLADLAMPIFRRLSTNMPRPRLRWPRLR